MPLKKNSVLECPVRIGIKNKENYPLRKSYSGNVQMDKDSEI